MRIFSGCFIVLLACRMAAGDGLIRDGLGARSAGRGGTNLAWADTGSILHDNPGGMVNIEGWSLVECAADILVADCTYSNANGGSSFDNDPVPLGNLTLLHKLDEDLAVGLGIFSTGGFAAEWTMAGPPAFPGQRTYKSFGAFGRILPGVSARLTDRLSVGATLGVAVNHIELEGPYTLQTGALRGTPTLMDLQATGAALTWSTGLQYQVSACTTVGATYQSETRFQLDGSSSTEVPGLGVSAFDADVDIVWPRSVGVGVRHEFTQRKIGAVDLIFYNWSQAYDSIGLFLDGATNPAFAAFGQIEEQYPLRWRDTLSVRLGFENVLTNQNRVRWGYVYHRNPIPASTLTPYITPVMEHTLSVGLGTHACGWDVDYGYQYMMGDTVNVGTSDFVGGDFDNSTLNAQAHFFFISFIRN